MTWLRVAIAAGKSMQRAASVRFDRAARGPTQLHFARNTRRSRCVKSSNHTHSNRTSCFFVKSVLTQQSQTADSATALPHGKLL